MRSHIVLAALISLIPTTALAVPQAYKSPNNEVFILDLQPNTTTELTYVNLKPVRRLKSTPCGMVVIRDSAVFPLAGARIAIGDTGTIVDVDGLQTRERPRCRNGQIIGQPGDEE